MIYTTSFIRHCTLLAESFYNLTGNALVDPALKGEELATTLYNAPFVLVSHGVEADPVFNFANQKAQELWEMSWEEFVRTPSRLSAEPMARSERQGLLERAQGKGYVTDYNGVRISKSGKRFQIIDTVLWNLSEADGQYRGQAALFKEWKFLKSLENFQ